MKWRPYGANAILIEFAAEPDEAAFHRGRALAQALLENPPRQMLEFVPGFTTLLVEFDLDENEALEQAAAATMKSLEQQAPRKAPLGPLKKIPVRYGGPDLERVAQASGLSVARVVELHAAPVYKVALLGFSPGFPYLTGLHPKLCTPRLAAPRPRVAAGSVAIGGAHTGIYSVASPGGWNIVGRTDQILFNPALAEEGAEEAAFLLKPGDQVQFVEI